MAAGTTLENGEPKKEKGMLIIIEHSEFFVQFDWFFRRRSKKPKMVKTTSAVGHSHPTYKVMIEQALASDKRRAVTQQDIKNYILKKFEVGPATKSVRFIYNILIYWILSNNIIISII